MLHCWVHHHMELFFFAAVAMCACMFVLKILLQTLFSALFFGNSSQAALSELRTKTRPRYCLKDGF